MPPFDRRTNSYQNNPDFIHAVLTENCQRMTPIFTTVMVVEAIIFFFELLLYERTPVMIAAMVLKLVAVLLSACSIYQFRLIRSANDPSKDSRNLAIIYVIIVLSLSWAVANTAVAQMITGDITVYVLVLFGIAAVVQMLPRHAIIIYGLFYLVFIAAIALIDIDHFKSVNDTYGHQTGDLIVKGVADIIRQSVREMDITGRYGGDEFMIIFPDCSVDNARRIIERLQKNLKRFDHQVASLTISCGIVQRNGEDANALVEIADRLLYRAKASGRNRIEA